MLDFADDWFPKIEVCWAGVVVLNFMGPGVVVGVVDSGLFCDSNIDFAAGLACGVCSTEGSAETTESISSSLAVAASDGAFLLASVKAEPKPLPNREPDGFSLSSLADGSGLNELCNLNS